MLTIDTTTKVELIKKNDNTLYEQYVQQMASGDQEALCSMYEQTKSAVYGFILSILKNAPDAEDVLQDTYIRIYTSAAAYQPQGKPLAWILTIARNLSLMKMRSDKKTVHLTDEDWDHCFSDNPAFSSEDRMVLSAAMNTLSSEECQIVMLHAISGFKHKEIAKLLQIPLSTALSKYNRAIKKLRKILTEAFW